MRADEVIGPRRQVAGLEREPYSAVMLLGETAVDDKHKDILADRLSITSTRQNRCVGIPLKGCRRRLDDRGMQLAGDISGGVG